MAFCVGLLALLIMFSRFIHIVACVSTSLFFVAEQHCIVWINCVLFIHSFVNRHLGCFHFGAIKNCAARNICVQVFVWMYVFDLGIYLGVPNFLFLFFATPPGRQDLSSLTRGIETVPPAVEVQSLNH